MKQSKRDKMALKIGRHYIEQELANTYDGKTLPSMFKAEDNNFWKYICYAILCHIVFTFLAYIAITFLGIHFPMLQKPDWKDKDIEFILTENEAPPINKNTKYSLHTDIIIYVSDIMSSIRQHYIFARIKKNSKIKS